MIITGGPAPILVEKNKLCEECGRVHDIEKCPKCSKWIEIGYGLMFGGFGSYKYCTDYENCDWFQKENEEIDKDY